MPVQSMDFARPGEREPRLFFWSLRLKITETVSRECCDARKDFVSLGCPLPGRRYFFCRHCGRHFCDFGGSEPESPGIQPLPWPWETARK